MAHNFKDATGVDWIHPGSRAECDECQPVQQIRVPAIEDMDNTVFLKHMDKRHAESVKCWPLEAAPSHGDEWVSPYRAFHDRLHEIEVPGQHDHEHLI